MSTRIKKSRLVLVCIILIAGVSLWGYSYYEQKKLTERTDETENNQLVFQASEEQDIPVNKDSLSQSAEASSQNEAEETVISIIANKSQTGFNAADLERFRTSDKVNGLLIGEVIFPDMTEAAQMKVRKDLLKYIKDHSKTNDNDLYMKLEDFALRLSDPRVFKNVSFDNKCKILAYTGTLGQQLQEKYPQQRKLAWSSHTLLTNFEIRFPDFIVEIKRKGYYNEPDIKKEVLKAEKLAESALIHAEPN